nr:PBPRA1643 family SWIM/SEC-C metal-binding motif protein [uncultured Thiodictyon sp.]
MDNWKGFAMAKLGSTARPLVLRVQSQDRAYFVAASCQEHGWQYVMGIEPDKPEDISDMERMLTPALPAKSCKIDRNGPCPCGSGKKYKKCCGAAAAGTPQ